MDARLALLLALGVMAAAAHMAAASAAVDPLALPAAMAQQLGGNCGSATECTGQCRQVCHIVTLARMLQLANDPNAEVDPATAAQLYHPKAVVVVTPIGVFEGPLSAMEYITVFSQRPLDYPPAFKSTGAKVHHIIAAGNKFVTVGDLFITNPFDANYTSPWRFVQMLVLDQLSRVRYHTIDWTQWASQSAIALNLQETFTEERAQAWRNILCDNHQQYCQGKNRQYNSTEECRQFLATIPKLPPLHRADADCLACRYLHGRFVRIDPDVHCPHIGPSGGGRCSGGVPSYDTANVAKLIPRKAFNSVPPFLQPLLALGGF